MGNGNFEKLKEVVSEGWGIELFKLKSVRSAYEAHTSAGLMSLKQTRKKTENLKFIKEAQVYLAQQGFKNMAPLVSSKSGVPYFKLKNDVFILTPWIEGREPSYKSISDIQMVAYMLAEMHCKSKGFLKYPADKAKYGKWPQKLQKKERELKLFVELAGGAKEKFDMLFLEHADWLMTRTREACQLLEGPEFNILVENAKKTGYLCHGDTAVRNCVVKNDETVFIDFDSMSQDLPVIDLWRLLRRSLRRNKWSIKFVNGVLEAYEINRKLSREEKVVLSALLTFPEKAWRLAHRYYEKKSSSKSPREEQYEDLKNFLADREEMNKFAINCLGG